MLDELGPFPQALIVAIKNVSQVIEPDSAGIGSHNRWEWSSHPESPACTTRERTFVVGLARASQAKNNPNVPVLVVPGTEGIFVIIAIDSPAIAKGFENVGPTVPIAILDPGNFGALGQVKPTILPCDSQDLVKPAGKRVQVGSGSSPKTFSPTKISHAAKRWRPCFRKDVIRSPQSLPPRAKGIVVMG